MFSKRRVNYADSYRIDSCIGEGNHRAFMAAMTAFVFAGYYGSYVTIETVCNPSPSDTFCDLHVAYRDFK